MKRFQESRASRFTFAEPKHESPILVVCPKCQCKAQVTPADNNKARVTCLACGFNNIRNSYPRAYAWQASNPTDGIFGLDLWLTTTVNGHTLWAFNAEHLDYLASYISTEVRERRREDQLGWHNGSLTSRLPRWIKSAKNRENLTKAMTKLQALL